jgi:hypothetical protein
VLVSSGDQHPTTSAKVLAGSLRAVKRRAPSNSVTPRQWHCLNHAHERSIPCWTNQDFVHAHVRRHIGYECNGFTNVLWLQHF